MTGRNEHHGPLTLLAEAVGCERLRSVDSTTKREVTIQHRVAGGPVTKKRYDPLWEIVDEKVALQGAEPEMDALCPWCNVTLHLGGATVGKTYECGLCGGASRVIAAEGKVALERVE